MNQPEKKPGIYFGWYVVAATVFIGFVTSGARNSFGVFITPMEAEFGWSRFEISTAAGLGVLVNGLAQPFVGRYFDRTGGRNLIISGIFIVGAATILLSLTFHILFLVFMFGVVSSLALSGTSLSNAASLLSRWFRRRRATAIGISASAISLGGMIMVPFAMYLLQATNWRVAWMGLGLVVMLGLPMAYLFIHENPAKKGLYPDGDAAPPENDGRSGRRGGGGPLEVEEWRDSFRSAPIWQLSASYFVCGTTTFVMSFHFIPFAEDAGISRQTASIIFGYMMGLNVIGGFAAGYLSDKIGGTKNWLALVYAMRGVAYLLLLTIPSPLNMWLFATVAGFSWVATLPLTSSLTADVYGLRALATISGITFMFHQIGGFASVLFAAFLYDVTGSYTIPFAVVGFLLLPAALSAFSVNERKYSSRYQIQPTPAGAAGN